MVLGLKNFAISGSHGPANYLNILTTFSYLISNAISGPDDKCSISGKYSGKTPL